MPIPGVEQPEIIQISDTLRLRRFDRAGEDAFRWYQDPETVWLVDGVREPYTREKLDRMYRWLDAHGELYFIEIAEDGAYRPIGDVTLTEDNLPMVIGEREYRGKRLGQQVVAALARRGRELGWPRLCVSEIYAFNPVSRACFERAGFRVCGTTERGCRLVMELDGGAFLREAIDNHPRLTI